MIALQVKGLTEATAKLAKAGAAAAGYQLAQTMDKAMKYVHSQVPPYPPPPPNSTYRRTGLLGRSIATEVNPLGTSIVGTIGTNVVYAPYVIGENQAAIHQGRWWQLEKVVEKLVPDVVKIFEDWAKGILGLP